jgi:hypothetical protein
MPACVHQNVDAWIIRSLCTCHDVHQTYRTRVPDIHVYIYICVYIYIYIYILLCYLYML